MKQLMTRHFSKWAGKQKISINELANALDEIGSGQFEVFKELSISFTKNDN